MEKLYQRTLVALVLFSIGWILSSCEKSVIKSKSETTKIVHKTDTVVATKTITNELAGAAYRKRAKGYFLVSGRDTANFMIVLTQEKAGGKFSIDLRFKKELSYREQWNQVGMIIPFALKDFAVDLDSLNTIFISRLITSGDLAIKIAREYQDRFGSDKTLSNSKLSSFLMQSSLASEWNTLFLPYQIEVDTIYTEKNFFASKRDIFVASVIETDSTAVPSHILDCITWLKLKRKAKSLS
jgi:hypothetical protein